LMTISCTSISPNDCADCLSKISGAIIQSMSRFKSGVCQEIKYKHKSIKTFILTI
jgi:hypothetical protein